MKIDKDKDMPLYHQVEEYIKEYISKNKLKPGDMLPTESELEDMLKVSRTTIRSAIISLQYSGYVIKQQGKGTFVADTSYEQQLPLLRSFTEDAIARGSKTHSIVLAKDIIMPDENLEQILKIDTKEKILKLSRLRFVDDEPMQLTTSYLPIKELKNYEWEDIDFTRTSLYFSLEKAGVILSSGEERMEVDIADSLDSMLLKIPEGFPIFVTQRIVFNDKGNIVEYADSRTRGDRHKAVIKLKR
ncbi:GntR family transcriptional regulator [Proteiniborus ethanoligenes]|uniref:GntR family transcriptional regulator n=1 Tax=Proteiniborus ethanoligenes TaxID=415015 RepID=A0A1H3LPH6_9FIRM|nr:GntR family transcriptional regulator [Proteiniborus ethanoligenes]SDY66019.1 GntR family transcriptional regulator [Proteiniborus ethanoligenes]